MSPDLPGELAYDVVDVFTDRPYGGNPLAVVHGSAGLSDSQLQAIAREFNLSETAFPTAPEMADIADGATYRLRIFSPTDELPFAGHPSVGTAWLLAQHGTIPTGRVRQACGIGVVALEVAPDGGPVELEGGGPAFGPVLEPVPLLRSVGLQATDLDLEVLAGAPARVVSAGLPFAVLPVVEDALPYCVPDELAMPDAVPNLPEAGIYVVAVDAEARRVRARMFAPHLGILEDAATGSAALALGVWLGGSGVLGGEGSHSFTVEQGVDMGRPSVLRCRVEIASDGAVRRVAVAGDVVHIASGRIRVPPDR